MDTGERTTLAVIPPEEDGTERGWLASTLRPMSADLVRTAIETFAGYLLLLLILRTVNPNGASPRGLVTTLIALFSWLWLAWWPAWRLRLPGGPFWVRLIIGVIRAISIGVVLAVLGALLATALYRPSGNFLRGGTAVAVAILFFMGRCVMVFLAMLKRWVERRLRWQLMASHIAAVVLTFITISFFGSIAVTALVINAVQPHPTLMAQSVATTLKTNGVAGSPSSPRVAEVLHRLASGSVPLPGAPPIDIVLSTAIRPSLLALVRPDGTLVTQVSASDSFHNTGGLTWQQITRKHPHTMRRLLAQALAGKASSFELSRVHISGWGNVASQRLGEAPLHDASGRLAGMAVVEVPYITSNPRQLIQESLTAFGIITVLGIMATSIPILAVSFLFAYFVARRFTRRLEDVSQVATSIAAGDLTQRAPIRSRNEIATLADDVNRMASHLQTAMRELEDAREQAVDALKSRQMLVASISHELRTPLAVVRAHLEALLERRPAAVGAGGGPGGEEGEITVPPATLQALQNETERLASLVDDLFTLSRAQTGAIQVTVQPVDVAALVDDVAALMGPLAQREGAIALTVQAAPGLPPAQADPDRLRQILENLIRNAVRHTPDGGIIILSVAAPDGAVILSVADTGEGIPPDHLPHIFERFYRVDEARSRSSGGAGLGLAIVRELVELMGGRVTVESAVGEGTVFRVYLLPAR